MRYEITVDIDAPPGQVWEVLQDIERWPEWTDSVDQIERLESGPFGKGSKAKVRQPRLRPAVWTVTEFTPGQNFTWTASSPGITTVAAHEIIPRANNLAAVRLTIDQTGPLASLISLFTKALTHRYLEMESQGLKRRTESP